MPKSAYIHIPFCKSKCKYCSFVSFCKLEFIESYISALKKEILGNYKGEKLKTLYFGGGTPSLIKAELAEEILDLFNLDSDCEITLELNPDDASFDYLKALKDIGINRISIGSQTFDDNILELIGRRHNSGNILKAVDLVKQAGVSNISLDLIYGLPTQTLESIKADLVQFLSLNIQHISTYGLKIEPESFWGKNPPRVPDDDIQADMYEMINKTLEDNAFFRYEISNFAKKGYESRHNLAYWNNDEYYGFGAAAHGYINGIRFSNLCAIEEYIQTPLIKAYLHELTAQEKLEEEIFLGFRKREGINVSLINYKYGINFQNKYKEILNKYSDYIEKTPEGYALNLKGLLISNVILADFIELQ